MFSWEINLIKYVHWSLKLVLTCLTKFALNQMNLHSYYKNILCSF